MSVMPGVKELLDWPEVVEKISNLGKFRNPKKRYTGFFLQTILGILGLDTSSS